MTAGDKRRVRLFLGDGPDRIEIGEAVVEEQEDGSLTVGVLITDSATSEQLGMSGEVKGFIPKIVGKEIPNE